MVSEGIVVRVAGGGVVEAICQFGEAHIPAHYEPLIGAAAAYGQVRRWWGTTTINSAVGDGLVVVAETRGLLIGVGQRGRRSEEHVVFKLYVHPRHRRRGVGPMLLDALIDQLPDDADRLSVEHFAANLDAGAFYDREGFAVDRIEPSPSGDEALAIVWRSRRLPPAITRGRPPSS